ncbi:hypothetical protein HNQ56_002375 [Anaerotaenia torta]|uniref:hypothetical protein n=1 Tax=Anaerotaenia torta TaxID=433293 RepID=UPI003D1FDB77
MFNDKIINLCKPPSVLYSAVYLFFGILLSLFEVFVFSMTAFAADLAEEAKAEPDGITEEIITEQMLCIPTSLKLKLRQLI